ncbi:DNA polymerase alpha-associated DNA helicase A [Trichomonascus vanleenenianus]|uniref:ATP-dependent 5'-3' DNA helicase HCS1 n=1 Tax=Trichomonascus vanleenenianus TaxID=2268995 RepID=UPI003EC966C2
MTSKFVSSFLDSIDDERKVDIEETNELLSTLTQKKLAEHGLAVLNLTVGSTRTGLGGKTILELELDPSLTSPDTASIDPGNVKVGDIVKVQSAKIKTGIAEGDNSSVAEAVVVKSTNKSIHVALEEKFENATLEGRLWLVKLTNSVTYKRMEFAMKDLEKLESKSHLHEVLLGLTDPQPLSSLPPEQSKIEFKDETLNEPQRKAIEFALANEVSVIHGPPGTGKTYTLIEIIRQLVGFGQRVLVCGPSNISVDNILERLHHHVPGNQLVRLGHPARLLKSNLIHSLEIVSKTSDEAKIVQDIRSEIDQNLRKVTKTRNGRERKQIWDDVKDLRKEFRSREKIVVTDILKQARVVVSTLHGSGSHHVREAIRTNPNLFDTIIIDEVSQSLEPQCWIPLMTSPGTKKLIIAGDNRQLPPTIKTKHAKHMGKLERTLFDRLEKLYGDKVIRMLTVQYRMNNTIMAFPSQSMYSNKLTAADSVAHRTLAQLEHVQENEDTQTEVAWFDTQGDDYPESESKVKVNFSRYNQNEAHLVAKYIEKLVGYGVRETDIGVISPYSAQVSLLTSLISSRHPAIEISTVDGFQGREKNAIIMSLVRSNDKREVGFLADKRRLNVAITRPRMHLCVIGNMECISSDEYMKQWVEWAEEEAVIEYPDVGDL